MTNKELDIALSELSTADTLMEERQTSKVRRLNRRYQKVYRDDRLLRIISNGYGPHRGYIDFGYKGKTLLHSGKHVKYPARSDCQRWIKKTTSKKNRKYNHYPKKGNTYRRLFDYAWMMY